MPGRRLVLSVPVGLLLLNTACGADRITSAAAPGPIPAAGLSQAQPDALVRWNCGGAPVSHAALVVVDGVVLGSGVDLARADASLVRPDEIASLEIFKGPAAVARFGPRASQGVIVLRTRRAATESRPTGLAAPPAAVVRDPAPVQPVQNGQPVALH